jgi:lipopolysaccharide biosynthesis glycosyltransferase
MPKAIVITGSNSHYAPLTDGLLASIEDSARADSVDMGILDVGLTAEQAETLRQRQINVVTPNWDYDLNYFRAAPPSFFKSMTARPHLPRYFPGYEIYVWIDADAWVQDWQAIRLYISTAQKFSFAITPECDRSYLPFLGSGSVYDWQLRNYQICFNNELAQKLAHFPVLNCGVFAARADAPHWQEWSEMLGEVLRVRREVLFYAEQTVLNAIIRAKNLPTSFLPATHNWACHRAMPMCSEDGILLLEPSPPFQPLGVVHLSASVKNGRYHVKDFAGHTHYRSLRFQGHDSAREIPDVGSVTVANVVF